MIVTTVSTLRSPVADISLQLKLIPTKLLKTITHPRYKVVDVIASPSRRLFYSEAGLGAQNSLTDKHFIKHGLSSDSTSPISTLIKFDGEHHKARLAEYREAFEKVHGRTPSNAEILMTRPWQALAFSDRRTLDQTDVPYVNYYRQAVNTAIDRKGKVHFYLGGMSIDNYIRSIIKIEHREQKPFEEFAAIVDYATLANVGRGEQFDFYGGVFGEGSETIEQPSITNIELYDATMGAFKEKGKDFKYYAKNDVLLDTKKLFDIQAHILNQVRSENNVNQILAGRRITSDAEQLINTLQKYIDDGR